MLPQPIRIWVFHKAPPQYQELSPEKDDRHWMVFVPKEYYNLAPELLAAYSEHYVIGGKVQIGVLRGPNR